MTLVFSQGATSPAVKVSDMTILSMALMSSAISRLIGVAFGSAGTAVQYSLFPKIRSAAQQVEGHILHANELVGSSPSSPFYLLGWECSPRLVPSARPASVLDVPTLDRHSQG